MRIHLRIIAQALAIMGMIIIIRRVLMGVVITVQMIMEVITGPGTMVTAEVFIQQS